MSDARVSPLGEAIERMGEAAQAYLDGPVAHLKAAADRGSRPDYGADTAAADAAGYWLHLVRSWWQGFNAVVDATAVLAMPPGEGHEFEVEIPPLAEASTVRVVDRAWTWMLDPEPDGVTITVRPPVIRQAGTDRVRIRTTPRLVKRSWDVVLEIAPVGAPGQATTTTVPLDGSTELHDVP